MIGSTIACGDGRRRATLPPALTQPLAGISNVRGLGRVRGGPSSSDLADQAGLAWSEPPSEPILAQPSPDPAWSEIGSEPDQHGTSPDGSAADATGFILLQPIEFGKYL
jgi:hypothetical protein